MHIIPEKNLKKETLEANGMNTKSAIAYQVLNYFRSPDLGQAIQQFLGEERLRNQVRHFLLFSSVFFMIMITSSFIFSFSSLLFNYYFFFCLLCQVIICIFLLF